MTNQQPLTSITDPDELWQKFFDATEDRQPREMLIASLKYIPAPGCALDLGCGLDNGQPGATAAATMNAIALKPAATRTDSKTVRTIAPGPISRDSRNLTCREHDAH